MVILEDQEQVTVAKREAVAVPVLPVVAETQEKAEQTQLHHHLLHMQVVEVQVVTKDQQHQEVLVVAETVVIQDNKVKQIPAVSAVVEFIHLTQLEERAAAE